MPIRIENLNLYYNNKKIIDSFSVLIPDNRIVAIVGLNGAGKSTLIKGLIGTLKIKSGNIFYDERNVKEIKTNEIANLISYVPQSLDVSYNFSVKEFVSLGLRRRTSENYRIVESVLIELGLKKYENKSILQLSMGELKLCYLAKALVQDAKWLILDEPTASLDYKREHDFLDKLKTITLGKNKSVILSIHNPNLALKYADYLLFIDTGKMLGIYENNLENYDKISTTFEYIYGKIIKESFLEGRDKNVLL